jgi:hypothetical protein
MIQTDFLQKLIYYYNQINFGQYKHLSKINENFVWYFADSYNKDVYMNIDEQPNLVIVDLDIKTAGPTICRNFYGNNNEFVQKLLTIEDKRERSIFISTNLDVDDLKCINIVCKIVIFGLIIELNRIIKQHSNSDIFILELKKDGLIFCCDKILLSVINNLYEYGEYSEFVKFIIERNFKFHYDTYRYYCRYNRTTIMVTTSGKIIRKGQFKYCPVAIKKISRQLFQTGTYDADIVKKYRDQKFIYAISKSNCKTLLDKYIFCDNNKILCANFQYMQFTPAIIGEIKGLAYLICLFSPLLKLFYQL